MDLRVLKTELNDTLTIFKSQEELKKWFANKKITINKKNKDEKVKEYYDFISSELKNRLNKIDNELGVYAINYEPHQIVVDKKTEDFSMKAAIASGVGAAGLLLIVEGMLGPVGWLAAGFTAIAGWIYGENKYHNEVVSKLFDKTQEMTSKIIINISSLIDTLIEKESKYHTYSLTYKPLLTREQLEIKNYLEQRNIKYLVHFTNVRNLPSIKKHGILSVSELKKNKIEFDNNDVKRLDGCLEYISLSITHVNCHLYNRFKSNFINKEYETLLIDAAILYLEIDNPRIYCETNAAAKQGRKGSKIEDLKAMFAENVDYFTFNNYHSFDRKNRAINETTADQAEILWFKHIPVKYIICK